jgi:hypothetical protein
VCLSACSICLDVSVNVQKSVKTDIRDCPHVFVFFSVVFTVEVASDVSFCELSS